MTKTIKMTKQNYLTAAVCAMVAIIFIFMGIIISTVTHYENEIAEMESTYEEEIRRIDFQYKGVVSEYEKLIDEMNELSEQVYYMMDGGEYEFQIEYEDSTHTYTGVKEWYGIKKSHSIFTLYSSLMYTE